MISLSLYTSVVQFGQCACLIHRMSVVRVHPLVPVVVAKGKRGRDKPSDGGTSSILWVRTPPTIPPEQMASCYVRLANLRLLYAGLAEWQTRQSQELVPLCVWVQVPHPAPPPRANVGGKMDVRQEYDLNTSFVNKQIMKEGKHHEDSSKYSGTYRTPPLS